MEQEYDICGKCGKKKKAQYPLCFSCGKEEPEQKTKKDKSYADGAKIGLCHNLTTSFLLGVTGNESALQSRIDYFWANYDKAFNIFKKKIEEKENGTLV